MAQSKAKSLSKLIALQKLGAARMEASLAATNSRRVMLDEERDALIAMQDRRYSSEAFPVDPSLLIKRLGTNALQSDRVDHELDSQRNALLKEQRRVEQLEQRLETVRAQTERKDFAMLIEEFISRKTTQKSE